MFENLRLERDARVGIIILDRSEVKNAINEDTMLEIREAIRKFRSDKKIRILMITGAEQSGSFSAGMDLKSVYGLDRSKICWITALGRLLLLEINTGIEFETDPVEYFEGILNNRKINWDLGENWKPIIAAINGYALGGGLELACACDFRFASDYAKVLLGYPEIDLRIFPAWGGTQFTTKILGEPQSKNLIFTGQKITAKKAKEIGLINEIYEKQQFLEKCIEFAKNLSRKDLNVLRNTKKLIEQSFGDKLIKGMALEYKYTKNW
ncbi:MAG: hypothetical protein GF329_03950 [Candidatus Lokiarchaeota archaeon]|nr:hypothetical protein [Candidatus Lokiarchaeota archaeon]